jgi:hypothetical protein
LRLETEFLLRLPRRLGCTNFRNGDLALVVASVRPIIARRVVISVGCRVASHVRLSGHPVALTAAPPTLPFA